MEVSAKDRDIAMRFSPDIERDLAALEKKMKKRAKRREIKKRIFGGAGALWLAIMLGIISDMLPDKSIPHAVLVMVCITLVFVAFGLLAWGFITLMNADLNNEL